MYQFVKIRQGKADHLGCWETATASAECIAMQRNVDLFDAFAQDVKPPFW